jgi:cytochrome c-type biogenesis protein CcmF
MFIGGLVLCMAAFQITFTTSIPVINKLFNTNMAPPIDAIDHNNSWQLPLAVLIALLIAFTQFFKYKTTNMSVYRKQIGVSLLLSLVLTVAIAYALDIHVVFHLLLLFGSLFATLANADYFIRIQKKKLFKSGAAIAHVGVGLMLLGILISTGKQEIISENTSGIEINMRGEENANAENIMLPIRDTLPMGDYYVTYQGKRKEGHHIYYQVDYLKWNFDGSYTHEFTLEPFIQMNKLMGNVPEPDTRHFWNKDIFTHITYADLEETEDNSEYQPSDTFQVALNDSLFASNAIVTLEEISTNVNLPDLNLNEDDLVIQARLQAKDANNNAHYANPVMIIRNNQVYTVNDSIPELGLDFNLIKITPETGKVSIALAEKKDNDRDFIIMQAMIFPYINVLWIGCFVMIIGTFIAIFARLTPSLPKSTP